MIEKIRLCNSERVLLEKIYYFSSNPEEFPGYIIKKRYLYLKGTYEQWMEWTGCGYSRITIQRAVLRLKALNLIKSEKLSFDSTSCYCILKRGKDYMKNYKSPSNKNHSSNDSTYNNNDINNNINNNKINIRSDIMQTDKTFISKENITHKVCSPCAQSISEEKKKPTNTTVQDMIKIWNEILDRNDYLNKNRARYLYANFKQNFNRSLEEWATYVRSIKESKWCKKFFQRCNGPLMWALSFKVVKTIFSGGFGVTLKKTVQEIKEVIQEDVKEVVQNVVINSFASSETQVINSIKKSGESEICKQLRLSLLKKIGINKYKTYLTKITLNQKDNNHITVNAANSFILDYCYYNFLRPMEENVLFELNNQEL